MQLKTCSTTDPQDATTLTLTAPEDCTESHALRCLPEHARLALQRGVRRIVIDLSLVQRMNTSLVATITVLLREARRAQASLQIVRAPDQFRTWAAMLNVLPILLACAALSDGVAD